MIVTAPNAKQLKGPGAYNEVELKIETNMLEWGGVEEGRMVDSALEDA